MGVGGQRHASVALRPEKRDRRLGVTVQYRRLGVTVQYRRLGVTVQYRRLGVTVLYRRLGVTALRSSEAVNTKFHKNPFISS